MFTPITKDQAIKILKTALYVGVSAVLGYLISVLTNQPQLFGVFTPLINLALVSIKQALTEAN